MADHNSTRPPGRVSFLLSLALATAPALAEEPTTAYSLYRTGAAANVGAVYMATFEADTPSGFSPGPTRADRVADYNRENCGIPAKLFMNQPGVSVQYSCLPAEDQ